MSSYEKLKKHYKKISGFSHLSAICGWDAAAMMPSGGNEARSSAMAELSLHIHQLSTSPALQALFEEAETEQLSQDELASLREMKRSWQQSTALPDDLVESQSLAGSKCEHAWRSQRPNNDWQGFLTNFKNVVALSRQEAKLRAELTGLSPYNAMLDIYEPGMTTEKLDALFADVKTWLPEFIQQAQNKQATKADLSHHYPIDQQKALSLNAMTLLGFNFDHGRLDVSTHPFCGGVPEDVRITTRYDESDFTSALMGVIHETGHARYEQGLPAQWRDLPVGEARSMGIHESQSLFFEMQLARNSHFLAHLAPMASQAFDRAISANDLASVINHVQAGKIRVDADEITYPMHVILRYEIERDLIEERIEAEDIPLIWAEKMKAYLNVDVEGDYQNGCMQDIHWTDGSFGYFPSYTLGAMYAAQWMNAMRKTVDVDAALQSGDLSPIFAWLSDNIWQNASLLSTEELVMKATGEPLSAEHFKRHLAMRYL